MKVMNIAAVVFGVALGFPAYGAWTYTDNGDGTGMLSDGIWTFPAMCEKNTQNLTVNANLGSSTATEPCTIDFTTIEGGYKVTVFNQFSSQHGDYQSESRGSKLYPYRGFISEFIAPDCVKVTGEGCFKTCTNLVKVVLNESVVISHGRAFEGCVLLSILSPRRFTANTTLHTDTFHDCSSIEGILEFPECVSFVNNAFYGCKKLEGIKAAKCTNIGQSAFQGCENLSDIELSAEIVKIGSQAFNGCSKIATEFVQGLLNKNLAQLGNSTTDLKQQIGCFKNCTGLTGSLVWNLPNLIAQSVPISGFEGCSSLECVEFNTPVHAIGEKAFYNMKNGAEVFLHEIPVEVYGSYAIATATPPFPKVYIKGNIDTWMDRMYSDSKNHLIKIDQFNNESWVSENRFDVNWNRIKAMIVKDASMCSENKESGKVTVLSKKVLAFVMSDTNAGCWVLKAPVPRPGFRFILR